MANVPFGTAGGGASGAAGGGAAAAALTSLNILDMT